MTNHLHTHLHPPLHHHQSQPTYFHLLSMVHETSSDFCLSFILELHVLAYDAEGGMILFLGNSWLWDGEAFSGHQMYLLSVLSVPSWIVVLAKTLGIASNYAFQFQEVLEFNETNRCMKFSQHSGPLCYSAVTSQV